MLCLQDWFGGMGMLDFMRSVGKFARVNVMLSRESVKQRLARDDGISYTECTQHLCLHRVANEYAECLQSRQQSVH